MNCPNCNSTMIKKGKLRNTRGLFQMYFCTHCGKFKMGEKLEETNIISPAPLNSVFSELQDAINSKDVDKQKSILQELETRGISAKDAKNVVLAAKKTASTK